MKLKCKLISTNPNGNYSYLIFSDGTKMRGVPRNGEEYKPIAPENIDIKLTNKCSIGCKYCHENSTDVGENGRDIVKMLTQLDIHGGEVALGGGALSSLSIDELTQIFQYFFSSETIANITVNQLELLNSDFFQFISGSIRKPGFGGIGVSLRTINGRPAELLDSLMHLYFENIVVHTIYGVTTPEEYEWLIERGCKVLILGYKEVRRGVSFLEENNATIERNKQWLLANLERLATSCKSLSFDCLAVKQLNMKDRVSEDVWGRSYMGDDGQFTMYLDLVKGEYAVSSSSPEEERFKISNTDNIRTIFKHIREVALSKTQN